MERVDGINSSTGVNYLDMSCAREYVSFEAVAYVHDIYLRTTRNGEGYATLVLKDKNANVVTARLFNLENYHKAGFVAEALKKKPIIFTGVVEVYQTMRNIVIDGSIPLRLWDGEFDYDMFVGRVDPDLNYYEKVCGTAPTKWETASIDSILYGKVGGYGKVIEVAINCLRGQSEDVYTLFKGVAEEYFRFLSEGSELLAGVSAFKFIADSGNKYKDSKLGDYMYMEALSSLIGIGKSEHLYVHKVVGAIQFAKKLLGLESKWDSMPEGTKESVGGDLLFKY